MSVKKRILAALLLVLFISLPVKAKIFDDTKRHWARDDIDYITNNKIMSGYSQRQFKPDAAMSRAEFYSVINHMANLQKTYTVTFSDVSTGDWYYKDISKAIKAGYLTPTTGKLNPENPIKRQDVCEILGYMYDLKKNFQEANDLKDSSAISKSSKGYVGTMLKIGAISGYPDGSFNPQGSIKRSEVAKIIKLMIEKYGRPQEKVLNDSKIKFGDRDLYN